MIRLRPHAAIAMAIAPALVAACAYNGGNGASGPAGYPATYDRQQAATQERVASRYDEQTIMQAQRALGEKGYDVGAIDGIWGPSSQSALANFQRMNGMTADGRLGPEVLDALNASNAKVSDARDGSRQDARREGARDRIEQRPGTTHAQAGTTDGAATAGRDLEAFYDTRTLLEVQRALADRGFEVGRADGVWGPESQSALRKFQQDQGLPASGRINAPTLAALDVRRGAEERSQGATR